jgi:putative membrane protein
MNSMARELSRPTSDRPFDPYSITRPDRVLLIYYILTSLLTGPVSPFVFLRLWIRYETLRYRFDESGVSMSWGFFFRREVYLTYRRIQDIHVTRGIIQRWFGLATVGIQTASGSASPEMNIEGILGAEQLRDFLYTRMRGAKGIDESTTESASMAKSKDRDDRALALLIEIRDLLQTIAARSGDAP